MKADRDKAIEAFRTERMEEPQLLDALREAPGRYRAIMA